MALKQTMSAKTKIMWNGLKVRNLSIEFIEIYGQKDIVGGMNRKNRSKIIRNILSPIAIVSIVRN